MKPDEYPLLRADKAWQWRAASQYLPPPPSPWRQWLSDPGSLTRRLQALSNGEFSVQVIEQQWQQIMEPTLSSCLPPSMQRHRMWSRRVMLCGHGQPWVMAHTLIPRASLRGRLRQLTVLDDRPLGAFLFRDRRVRRGRIEVARAGNLWGRRSLFYMEGRPLLVAEFFLPALMDFAGHEQQRS